MTNINYQKPNADILRQCRTSIRQSALIELSNLYIPALANELKAINSAIIDADQIVNNTLLALPVSLGTEGINSSLEALNHLKNLEPTNELRDAISDYSSELQRQIRDCRSSVTAHYQKLHTGFFNVSTASISNNDYRLAELAQSKRLMTDKLLPEENGPLHELKSQITTLDNLIKLYNDETISDKLKPLIDIASEIAETVGSNIETPNPRAIIKNGISIAAKTLVLAEKEIKYDQIVAARERTRVRVFEREARVSQLELEIEDNGKKTNQLLAASRVAIPRDSYIAETKKIFMSLDSFIEASFSNAENDVLGTGKLLVQNCPTLVDYCKAVQPTWSRG